MLSWICPAPPATRAITTMLTSTPSRTCLQQHWDITPTSGGSISWTAEKVKGSPGGGACPGSPLSLTADWCRQPCRAERPPRLWSAALWISETSQSRRCTWTEEGWSWWVFLSLLSTNLLSWHIYRIGQKTLFSFIHRIFLRLFPNLFVLWETFCLLSSFLAYLVPSNLVC